MRIRGRINQPSIWSDKGDGVKKMDNNTTKVGILLIIASHHDNSTKEMILFGGRLKMDFHEDTNLVLIEEVIGMEEMT